MAEAFIQLRHLHKALGGREVIRDVNLDVQQGETLVVIGSSGCGKSVLLKLIIGLLKPTSGEVLIEGLDLAELSELQLEAVRSKIGFLFQSAALFDSLTVGENVAFPLQAAGMINQAQIDRKVAETLALVELTGEQEKMPEHLSGGMKIRVGLARAIVNSPTCILYDEPTTGLDPIAATDINHLIRSLQQRSRVTSVVVTHDMRSAFYLADQIAYLLAGRIYFKGTPAELQASPDPQIQHFIAGTWKEASAP
jgi:phospholipid/cholesterol/gamma-HCH transport system ATP-binding protein